MEELYLPREIKKLIAGRPCTRNTVGMSAASVLMFEDMVLKIRPETEETRSEREMLSWLSGKLPAPEILCHVVENGTDYLLMSRIPGRMACDAELMKTPARLVQTLADALLALWQVDITGCPVSWTLPRKLAAARGFVEAGEVDVEDAEPDTFGPAGFASPEALITWLEGNRPPEDLVLTHGDFCLPNVFVEDGKLSGFIDLGRAGVADRWQDIALCWRSLSHNYAGIYGGPVYPDFDPDSLFDALGIEKDEQKLRYYILLDELF